MPNQQTVATISARAPGFAPETRRTALEILDDNPALQVDRDAYNINVTSNFGDRVEPEALWEAIRGHAGAGEPAHLYFHVPLCNYVCKFCNYVKRLSRGSDAELELWTELLIRESARYLEGAPWLPSADIQSLYFGGGTAAMLRTRDLARLMQHVRAHYALRDDAEISLEGNPDNFIDGEPGRAVSLGFNRFSLGVQTLQDAVSDFVGRKHKAQDSLRAIEALHATGKPFNVDVMFGLPFQTVDNVTDDITQLIAMRVPTITIYRFRNAKRHELGIGNKSAWNDDRLNARMRQEERYPSLETTYAMREAVTERLIAAGYRPSPCGWWSLPDTYAGGNIPQVSKNKWQRYDSMIAFGPGAYGWLTGAGREVIQTHNITDIARYQRYDFDQSLPPLAYGRRLVGHEAVAARLGFAFKANQPIDIAAYEARFGIDITADEPYAGVIAAMISAGFLQWGDATSLLPTQDGETIHEEVISHYIHGMLGADAGPVCHRAEPVHEQA